VPDVGAPTVLQGEGWGWRDEHVGDLVRGVDQRGGEEPVAALEVVARQPERDAGLAGDLLE
jgi:hypothetical protein